MSHLISLLIQSCLESFPAGITRLPIEVLQQLVTKSSAQAGVDIPGSSYQSTLEISLSAF